MAITTTTIAGTDSLSGSRITINDNFKTLENALNSVLSAFDLYTKPLLAKVFLNASENQTLAELRDTLLPKLMSGEIRVADAEREVEEAV